MFKKAISNSDNLIAWLKTNKLWSVSAAIALILIAVSVFILVKPKNTTVVSTTAPVDKCIQHDIVTFGCYKDELESITKDQGPEAAMALLKDSYNKESYVKSQCHQLVHVIGRAAFLKYNEDLGDTFTHGDQFCWSGYYHGALEELSKQKGSQTVTEANSVCASLRRQKPYSFDHYNCVHGLGHGFMFILGQDLFKSLKACDRLNDSYERTSCYGGVFMQNIMNVQTPDKSDRYASPYLREDKPMYPCTDIEDRYREQCYLMQTSYALSVENYDFSKVFALCDATESKYRDTCYRSLGRDASGNSVSDVERTKNSCLLGKDYEAQSNCIDGAAKDFVSYFHDDQQALQLCGSLPEKSLSDYCTEVVNNYYQSF